MTLTDTTAAAQKETLSFTFDLPHSPAKVWRALTDPTLLSEWLLPIIGDFNPAPGAAFTFKAQPQPGWDGTVQCRLLAIEPQHKLSYSWSVPFLETVVTFTLTPTTTGTHLALVQSGFKPNQKQEFGGARYGWRLMGGRLIDLLAQSG